MNNHLLRYEALRTAGNPILILRKFKIISETNTGYWIECNGKKKFVKKNSICGFARNCEDKAWDDFVARKKKQIQICRKTIEFANSCLSLDKDKHEDPLTIYDEMFLLREDSQQQSSSPHY